MKRYIKADIVDISEESDDYIKEILRSDNPNPRLLHQIAKHPDKYIRDWVASLTATAPETLAMLSDDPEERIREAVALHPGTPDDVILKLASDPDIRVRERIAQRKDISTDVILTLLDDRVENLRWDVLSHLKWKHEILGEDIDLPIFKKLAHDPAVHIRLDIVEGYNEFGTPPEILAECANDENRHVRRAVAEVPTTPVDALIKLTDDPESRVRWTLARYAVLPDEYYWKLAKDSESFVRRGVSCNENTPTEVLEYLLDDENAEVSEYAGRSLGHRGVEV